MLELTRRSRDILVGAGWSDDRRVDAARWADSLRGRGYDVHPAATEFLRSFGGLDITFPRPDMPHITEHVVFDPIRTAKRTDPEVLRAYSDLFLGRQPLTPIGEASDGYLFLHLAADGSMYGAWEGVLRRLGRAPVEGIETLCAVGDGIVLGELPDD